MAGSLMTNQSPDATIKDGVQLPLELPGFEPRYEPHSFIISKSNEAAARIAKSWLGSDEPLMTICGAAGAGKTHLARITAGEHASYWQAPEHPQDLSHASVFVMDNLPSPPKPLLNFINDIVQAEKRLILVGRGRPEDWAGGLPDLATRIGSAPRAEMNEPDEDLIRIVIAKTFRDRQLAVNPTVIDYAAPRLPRTFAAAHAFVAAADALALKTKRGVTISLAKRLVQNIVEE